MDAHLFLLIQAQNLMFSREAHSSLIKSIICWTPADEDVTAKDTAIARTKIVKIKIAITLSDIVNNAAGRATITKDIPSMN